MMQPCYLLRQSFLPLMFLRLMPFQQNSSFRSDQLFENHLFGLEAIYQWLRFNSYYCHIKHENNIICERLSCIQRLTVTSYKQLTTEMEPNNVADKYGFCDKKNKIILFHLPLFKRIRKGNILFPPCRQLCRMQRFNH